MVDAIVILLTILEVAVALLLIGIILVQQSKAGGGLGALSGALTENVLGANAGNVLTKATVVLAAIFLGTTLVLAIITGHRRPDVSVADEISVEESASLPQGDDAVEDSSDSVEATAEQGDDEPPGTGTVAAGGNEDDSDSAPAESVGEEKAGQSEAE